MILLLIPHFPAYDTLDVNFVVSGIRHVCAEHVKDEHQSIRSGHPPCWERREEGGF